MDKKYQIFVSSTYEDLKTERQAAISCLLDMDLYSCRDGAISSGFIEPVGVY